MRARAAQQQQFFTGDEDTKDTTRALRVSIIGCPNAGKSALTNALVRSPVCAVSKLIDTTRQNATTALTEGQCQLEVVDSPGLVAMGHAKRVIGTHSEDAVLTHPEKAIERAELIVVVQDATLPGEYLKHRILYLLYRYSEIPACLVINKVDLVKNRPELFKLARTLTEGLVDGKQIGQGTPIRMGILGSIIEKSRQKEEAQAKVATTANAIDSRGANAMGEGLRPRSSTKIERDPEWYAHYNKLIHFPAHKAPWTATKKLFTDQQGWPHFKACFLVSAKTGEGVDELREFLRANAVARRWTMEPEAISKTDPRQICAEHLRSALMNECPSYVAYKLRVVIMEWEDEGDAQQMRQHKKHNNNSTPLRIAANVHCAHERDARLVWSRLEDIERSQSQLLQTLFARPVQLRVHLRVSGQNDVYQPDPVAEERRQKYRERKEAQKAEKLVRKMQKEEEEIEEGRKWMD